MSTIIKNTDLDKIVQTVAHWVNRAVK